MWTQKNNKTNQEPSTVISVQLPTLLLRGLKTLEEKYWVLWLNRSSGPCRLLSGCSLLSLSLSPPASCLTPPHPVDNRLLFLLPETRRHALHPA